MEPSLSSLIAWTAAKLLDGHPLLAFRYLAEPQFKLNYAHSYPQSSNILQSQTTHYRIRSSSRADHPYLCKSCHEPKRPTSRRNALHSIHIGVTLTSPEAKPRGADCHRLQAAHLDYLMIILTFSFTKQAESRDLIKATLESDAIPSSPICTLLYCLVKVNVQCSRDSSAQYPRPIDLLVAL